MDERWITENTKTSDWPIHVFHWRHGVGDELSVDGVNRVQGKLDDQTVDWLVLIDWHDALHNLEKDNRNQESLASMTAARLDEDRTFITNLILRCCVRQPYVSRINANLQARHETW